MRPLSPCKLHTKGLTQMLKYLKKYRLECVCAPLFKMFEALLDLLVPLVVASIIDAGIGGGNAGHVWRMSGLLIALALVGLAAAITAQYFAAKAATGFAADVRHALFAKLASLSFPDVDRLGTSAMITRMTSDVNQAQTGVNMALRLLLRSLEDSIYTGTDIEPICLPASGDSGQFLYLSLSRSLQAFCVYAHFPQ